MCLPAPLVSMKRCFGVDKRIRPKLGILRKWFPCQFQNLITHFSSAGSADSTIAYQSTTTHLVPYHISSNLVSSKVALFLEIVCSKSSRTQIRLGN